MAANNYAMLLSELNRFEEVKTLMRKTISVARRVLGENHEITLRMRRNYAEALYKDASSTLDDLREAVTTLEEIEPIMRRVFGSAHPLTVDIEQDLINARGALADREMGYT